jgi:hypothetical protein
MLVSSQLCREQIALHRERAKQTNLPNVRRIADQAVASWSLEAEAAEKREKRHSALTVARAGRDAARHETRNLAEAGVLSENPDRGLAVEPGAAVL